MSADRFADIRARLAAATPGPWEIRGRKYGPDHVVTGEPSALRSKVADYAKNVADYTLAADAEFIANAPADIACLLAEVDRLRASLERIATCNAGEDYLVGTARAALAPAEGDG